MVHSRSRVRRPNGLAVEPRERSERLLLRLLGGPLVYRTQPPDLMFLEREGLALCIYCLEL